MDLSRALPVVNAALNALSASCLAAGLVAIRRRAVARHRARMLAAFSCSALFLVGYLSRLALYGTHTFVGPRAARVAYLVVLFSHMVLAVLVLPMIFRVLFLAWRGRFAEHRRLARWTWPIWMYVSVTGVVVYAALYHIAPALREVGETPVAPVASSVDGQR